MGIGVQQKGDGPSVVVGLGADFSAAKAAKQALLEVGQVRPALKQRLRTTATKERLHQLLEDPSRVEELEDHDLLYTVPKHLNAFDFLFKQPLVSFDWNNGNGILKDEMTQTGLHVQLLVNYLRAINSDLLYYNLTPPDMEELGLFTARVILPDFQPIHFGWKNIRLASKRLYEVPVKLGFHQTMRNSTQLNMNPHPVA
jgi:ribosomal protein S12 methylthiotransferase accessory factor